jgi:serine/threonine-protein kinase RsbW
MKADFTASCSKQSLAGIRDFVSGQLRAFEVEESLAHQLVLAVDEACANSIIHHHGCDGSSSIQISLVKAPGSLVIELIDQGNPFPIDAYQPKEIEEIIRNRTKGGLGILLINKIMDKIEVLKREQDFVYRFTKIL